jgi:hypothetical protein
MDYLVKRTVKSSASPTAPGDDIQGGRFLGTGYTTTLMIFEEE